MKKGFYSLAITLTSWKTISGPIVPWRKIGVFATSVTCESSSKTFPATMSPWTAPAISPFSMRIAGFPTTLKSPDSGLELWAPWTFLMR